MYISLPSLRVPRGKKATEEWVREIFNFVSANMSVYTSRDVRASVKDKIINIDLYNNKIHPEDFSKIINPLDLKVIDATREIEHYPVAAPIIDLLVGEEIDRPFEPSVAITNNIQIEDKQQRLKQYIEQELERIRKQYSNNEEVMKAEMQKLVRYLKYTYKDVKEKKASALLEDSYERLKLGEKFVEGFRRVWLTGEEAYEIDLYNGQTTVEVLNTANVRLYGGGRSNRFEDYDIIVVENHFSPGYLIDRYGSKLKEEDIERIITYQVGEVGSSTLGGRFDKPYGDVTHEFVPVGDILGEELSSNFTDSSGGIRHMRIRFKAYKKLKKVLYQDPTTGEQQTKIMPFSYRLREGEALKETISIPEWWIGTLIGSDIIVDVYPIPIRYNKLDSLAESHPGVVGRIYNINERKVLPPMSRIRSYQYLFDVTMDNLAKTMSKNIGPILEMDFAKKPSNWGTMKWLQYMFKYNTKFVDSFKEVNKGPATGQLAGNLASGRDQVQNVDFSGYIAQLVNILDYLERVMGNMLGVVPQRLGAISNRETVGGIERATSQSSHITEWYFYTHEECKLDVLNILIEAEKSALKDNPRKLKYLLDKKVLEVLTVTEDDLADVDLGVFVTNSREAKEYKRLLEQSAHAFMQNGGEFSFVFDIITSPSMAEKRRLIEEYESQKRSDAQQAQQAQQEAFQQEQARKQQFEQSKLDLEKYKIDTEAAIKMKLKEYDAMIAEGKVAVDRERTLEEIKMDILKLQEEIDKNNDEFALRSRELDIKEKESNKRLTA